MFEGARIMSAHSGAGVSLVSAWVFRSVRLPVFSSFARFSDIGRGFRRMFTKGVDMDVV